MAALEQYLTEPPTQHMPTWQQALLTEREVPWMASFDRRLKDFRALPRGWDGGDASPLRNQVSEFASTLIRALSTYDMPQLVPLPDGGLQFEWHSHSVSVEILISRPPVFDVLIDYPDTGEMLERSEREVPAYLRAALEAASE